MPPNKKCPYLIALHISKSQVRAFNNAFYVLRETFACQIYVKLRVALIRDQPHHSISKYGDMKGQIQSDDCNFRRLNRRGTSYIIKK